MADGIQYYGISGATLPVDEFDLGHGAQLRRTFAHLMSPCLMAFAPAKVGEPHPAPWRAARGGFGFDIQIELRIDDSPKPGGLSQEDTAAWLIPLMRLAYAPYLSVPVTIDMPFTEAISSPIEPTISPLEIQECMFRRGEDRSEELPLSELEWLRDAWRKSAELAMAHSSFYTAVLAWDSCRIRTRTSQAVLILWGAIEQLFSPSTGELRHRVAANLASYLEPRGPRRLATYKRIMKLYNARSVAAHTAKDIDKKYLIDSWITLRNSLMKMLSENKVPAQSDFEYLIFADVAPVETDAVSWGGVEHYPET